MNYKCKEHTFSREKVGATCHHSVNGYLRFHDVCQAIDRSNLGAIDKCAAVITVLMDTIDFIIY